MFSKTHFGISKNCIESITLLYKLFPCTVKYFEKVNKLAMKEENKKHFHLLLD